MVHIPPGRRGALAAASAAVVCLGAFAALGPDCEGNGAGYVAVGAPGPPGGTSVNAPPSGDVDLVPLDGRTTSPPGPGRRASPGPDAPGRGAGTTRPPEAPSARPGDTAAPSRRGGGTATTAPGTPGGRPAPGGTTPSSSPPAPGAPAHLEVSAVERSKAADRWCEKVTVTLSNSGDRPATTGTVVFGTHIIGLLGIDWGTVESSRAAPVPVPGGGSTKGTWEVCVDAWRVPLGMHVETRDISVRDS
ncbi:hypothetical protein [Streptomyces sp. NPDC026673]|uniref:hypothetical protein n=1 Tax=Streptomyces sp. NPDC026673 TaxID=3155724 RepID=UPI0033CAB4C1